MTHHSPAPRTTGRRTAARATALAASAAMVVLALQSGTAATAAGHTASNRDAGATALPLSAPQRATALKDAQADAPAAARQLGLGSGEKLVARDVVRDADGTTHTRYERTYDGLPVLGGDLVTHTAKNGDLKGVSKAHKGAISVASTDASLAPAAAKKSALAVSDAKSATAKNVRKVVWAGSGKPVLAYETVVTGTQADGTPSELHVVTDAATGKKLYSYEGIENGTGTSEYSGTVTVGSTASAGGGFDLTDGGRGGHKTYDLNGGTSGTGTLFHDADDQWGDGTVTNRQTAAVDAAYGAAETWDYYKSAFDRERHRGRRQGRLLPCPLRQRLRQRLLVGRLLLHDVRRRAEQPAPAHGARRGRPRDEPWPDRVHRGPQLQPRVGRPERGDVRHLRHVGGVLREQQQRRRRLPHRREDQHQRQRHPAAVHGQAQQGRRLRRLLVQRRSAASTCTTRRASPTTSSTS